MRVLVCGGRDYTNIKRITRFLDSIRHKIDVLITGHARGADYIAEQWAIYNNVELLSFPADWDTHKTLAGPLRNAQMLREGKPDVVIAFPGGKGTAHMVSIAKKAKIKVFEVKDERL